MISKKAVLESKDIGSNVVIYEYAVIRKDVIIEDGVVIHPFVVIESGCRLGRNTEVFPGTYIGKKPKGAGATTRGIDYKKKVSIGRDCAVGPNAVVFYDVEVGNKTLIGDGASIREKVIIGDNCLIGRYVTINYNSKIGNNTKIMDLSHITGNCLIGNNVFISIHVSTVNDNVVINRLYDEARIKGPIIQDNVTLGANAIVLPGVVVGSCSVVGAGSVVTKDVPESVLVLGCPGRIVRELK